MIVSLAGGNSTSDFADGVGFNARFDRPQGITLNWNESALIIADCYNQRIRHMEIASRNVTTLAGNGSVGIVDGPGLAATFEYPYGAKWHCVASSNRCGVLVADSANNAIRFDWPKLTATFSKDTTSGSVTEETTSPTQSTTRSASVTSSLTYTTSTTKNVSLSGSLPAGRTASPSTSATRTDDSRSHTPAFHCALLLSDGATSAGTLEQFNANAPEEVVALAPANGTLLAAPVSRSAVLRNPPLAVNLSFFLGGTIRRGLQDAWRPTRVMLNVLPADASFPLLTAAVPFTTESIVTLYRNETLVLLLYPPNSKSPPRWLPSSLSTFRDVTLVLQLTIRCPTDESATSDVIGGAVPRAGALESEVKSLSIVAQYSALFSVPVIGGAVGRMLSVRHLALCDGSDVTEGMLLW
ncbi:Hypothetical protein, putative [Bodo saltans]|uniref:Uncharacterized protein n=1 Tax=Bodo saltans TaxID=75058 RepID=A0A0S4KKR6_BODSA|nr:Hypothetical protein, putative [Bodo saltans]|eukprot:CUI14948.1 Hypothetical protein, putative [Bodo saltans]